MKLSDRPSPGYHRPPRIAPLAQGLDKHPFQKPGRAGRRRRVEDRKGERLPELFIKPGTRAHAIDNRMPLAGREYAQERKIVTKPGARDAVFAGQQRPQARQIDRPIFGRLEIKERKAGLLRSGHAVGRADDRLVAARRPIARQEKMIAVVDRNPEGLVDERAAPSACLTSGLI